MIQELVNTSVPAGLEPGTEGFCTVACTQSMAPNIRAQLELMGGYRPVWKLGDAQVDQNPVLLSHYRLLIGGCFYNVLSRIATCGADHQGRLNRIAHHIILETYDQQPQGPSEILLDDDIIFKTWEGPAKYLPMGRIRLNASHVTPMVCKTWEKLTGDAGWAGEIVQAAVNDPTKPSYIIYKPGMDTAALLREAMSIVPISRRWDITFSTHFDILPTKADFCTWRFCVAGSKAAALAEKNAINSIVIDLTKPVKPAGDHHYPRVARTGDDDPDTPEDISFSQPAVEPAKNNFTHTKARTNSTTESSRNFEPTHFKKPPKNSSPVRILLSLAALAIIILQAIVITDLLRNSKKSEQKETEPTNAQPVPPTQTVKLLEGVVEKLNKENDLLKKQLTVAKNMQQSQKNLIEQLQQQNRKPELKFNGVPYKPSDNTPQPKVKDKTIETPEPVKLKPAAKPRPFPEMRASAQVYRQLPLLVPIEQHKSVTNAYSLRLRGQADYARLVLPCDLPDGMTQSGNIIEIQSTTSLGNKQTQKIIELASSPKGLEIKSFPVEYNENNKLLPKLKQLEETLKYSAVKVSAITYQFYKSDSCNLQVGNSTKTSYISPKIPIKIKSRGREFSVNQTSKNSWQLTIPSDIKLNATKIYDDTHGTFFRISLADDSTPKAITAQINKTSNEKAQLAAKLADPLEKIGISVTDSLKNPHREKNIKEEFRYKLQNAKSDEKRSLIKETQAMYLKFISTRRTLKNIKRRQQWLSEDHSFDIEMIATRSGAVLYKIKVNYKK